MNHFYSRKVMNERVLLPQEPKSNEVAIAVLDEARAIENLLVKDDRNFTAMFNQVDFMLKQTATYIESQQIYNIVRQLQQRIQARKDVDAANALEQERMQDEAEEADLMKFLASQPDDIDVEEFPVKQFMYQIPEPVVPEYVPTPEEVLMQKMDGLADLINRPRKKTAEKVNGVWHITEELVN